MFKYIILTLILIYDFLEIDECSLGTDNCDFQAICINSEGSFTCTCGLGYSGDGESCEGNDHELEA